MTFDKKAYMAKWRAENKERIRAYQAEYMKTYLVENAERIAAQQRGYREANKDAIAARVDEYRRTNQQAVQARQAAWVEANAEHVKAKRREAYARTRADSIAKAVSWNRSNGEKRKAITQRYDAANPQVKKAAKANRRALESAAGGKASKEDVVFLEKKQKLRCAVCRVCLKAGYELDHIVPLVAGGRTERTNLQLLCMPCNRSKGAKNPTDFMQQRGFLL